jgi:hypothetical protein
MSFTRITGYKQTNNFLGDKDENKKSGCSDDIVSLPGFMGR